MRNRMAPTLDLTASLRDSLVELSCGVLVPHEMLFHADTPTTYDAALLALDSYRTKICGMPQRKCIDIAIGRFDEITVYVYGPTREMTRLDLERLVADYEERHP